MRSQFLQSPRLSAIGRRGGDPLAALTSTVVFDPSKRSSLAQDSGGTTAVSADGDPVGRMADLKANTYHATQATAASRPTYKADGACHWLAGDGVSDFMSLDWYQTAGNSQSVCFGFSLSAEKTWPFLFGGSVGNRGLEVYGFSGDEDMRALACTTGGAKAVGSGDFILAVNRDVVLTATWDRSTGNMALYRDGVQVATASHPAANLTVAAAHDLFRGLASNTYCLPGRIYRAVLYDGLWSESERAAAEAWVAKNVHTVAYYLGDSTIAAYLGHPSVASLLDSTHAETSLAAPGDTIAGQ
ncbi:MAG: hypothetical protein KDK28_08600, partial [Maritimibacter sp.]|nr:hypothetical protein [Maritimibacter sp.]